MAIVKVQSKTDEQIAEIGRKIGSAFAAENSGIVTKVPREDVIKIFEIMTEFYYKLGVLYTLQEIEAGFIAFWTKDFRIPLKHKLRLVRRMLREVPIRSCLNIAPTGSEQFAKIYRHEQGYVAVSTLVVLEEFQHQGFMPRLLETPFSIASERGIPCVLDTDTELKIKKYEKCGMRITGCIKMMNGFPLYTMEYRAL